MKKVSIVKTKMTEASVELLKHKHELLLNDFVDIDNRIITLGGEIEEGWFEFLDSRINLLEGQNQSAITIRLCSCGGDTYQAAAVVGRMRSSKCKFIVEGYGAIMSAATLVLAAGHKRKLSKYAWFMYHGSNYELGNRTHMEAKDYVRQVDREMDEWCRWMAEFTGKDASFWKNLEVDRVDHYMTPDEAQSYNVVDELI